MKKNSGITLIALVITIIVMLILVGVSVTVALNGGLFTRAKTAASGTEEERQKELALSNGDIVDQWVNGGATPATSATEIEHEPINILIPYVVNGQPDDYDIIIEGYDGITWAEEASICSGIEFDENNHVIVDNHMIYNDTACTNPVLKTDTITKGTEYYHQ